MLELPAVTLACVDCINQAAAVVALRKSMRLCRFARVVLITHDSPKGLEPEIEVALIPKITSREAYSQFMLNELGAHFSTPHVLVIQWDGYVVNATAWKDDFLKYDYIGAKWWHKDGYNVGNGGFSLRSRKLVDAVRALGLATCTLNEDDVVCRSYRARLESLHKIKYASEMVADQFAFERGYEPGETLPFGFHGFFNMWRILTPGELGQLFRLLDPRTIAYVETLELAQQYSKRKRYDEAIWVTTCVLDHNPDNINALKMLCGAAHYSGRKWTAIQALKELHRLDPKNPEILKNLGDLAASASRPAEAASYFRSALELNPTDETTRGKLAKLELHCVATV